MGENHDHHGTDSKPVKKSIKIIDSIFIDLFSSDDKCDDQTSEIFSIRGYVSDMRKKDLKMCWPFADIGDLHKMDEHILSVPPVYDSSFDEQRGERRWQESSDMAADQGFIFNGCQDVINGRTRADNASNSSCDQKEKKLEVADNCTVALISQTEPGYASPEVHEIEPEKSLADQEHHTAKLQEHGDASMESFESKVSSSESAETVGNSRRPRYQGTLRRRRAPKFRLLTELLAENGNMKAKQPESSPSNVTPKASLQAAPMSVMPSRTSKYAADRAAILAHDDEFSSRNSRSTSLNAMESKSSTSKNPNSSKESLNNYANPQWNHKRIRRRRRGENELSSDRGTSDDIPMEIVELMAKNQYERRLPDAENKEHVSETGHLSNMNSLQQNHMLCHNVSIHSQEESSNGYDMTQACSWSSFEACSHKDAESSFRSRPNVVERHQNRVGSIELYSNETISAMHLLSLMDARTQPNAPFQLSSGFGTDTDFSGRAVFKSRNGSKMKCSAPSASRNDRKPLTGTLKNKTSISETETCSVNKNPADFSFSKNRSSSRSDDRSKRPRIV